MSVIEKEVKINSGRSVPKGFAEGTAMTMGFHKWGGVEYLDFYPIDLALPISELEGLCGVLNRIVIGDYVLVQGLDWGGSYEQKAFQVSSELLGGMSWQIALKIAATTAKQCTPAEARKVERELMHKWAEGKWPYNWKRP